MHHISLQGDSSALFTAQSTQLGHAVTTMTMLQAHPVACTTKHLQEMYADPFRVIGSACDRATKQLDMGDGSLHSPGASIFCSTSCCCTSKSPNDASTYM